MATTPDLNMSTLWLVITLPQPAETDDDAMAALGLAVDGARHADPHGGDRAVTGHPGGYPGAELWPTLLPWWANADKVGAPDDLAAPWWWGAPVQVVAHRDAVDWTHDDRVMPQGTDDWLPIHWGNAPRPDLTWWPKDGDLLAAMTLVGLLGPGEDLPGVWAVHLADPAPVWWD